MADIAIERLNGSRRFLLGLLETFTDEQLTHRAADAGNHAIWVMGHLAFADDFFVSVFRNEPSDLPGGHADRFRYGTAPSNNAADYPGRDVLLDRLTTARDRAIAWAGTLDGDAAMQPAPEAVAPIASNAIAAAHALSQHEFLHAGQLTAVRASLGMKPVFG